MVLFIDLGELVFETLAGFHGGINDYVLGVFIIV